MKYNKFIILVILSLLFVSEGVYAATSVGLCAYGTAITDAKDGEKYCQIPPVSFNKSTLDISNQHLKFTIDNNISVITETNKRTANILGTEQQTFCLDPNLNPPRRELPYKYVRMLRNNGSSATTSDYDIAITKLYQLYAEDYLGALNRGASPIAAGDKYYQLALITMRAISFKYGVNSEYGNEGYSSGIKRDAYKELVKQFSGKDSENKLVPKTDTDRDRDNLIKAQNWYCQALLSYKDGKNVTDYDKKYCKGKIGTDKTSIYTYDVKVKSSTENVTTTFSGSKFTKTIPLVISGLDSFNKPEAINSKLASANHSPKFEIFGVKCNEAGITCKLSDESLKNKNILPRAVDGKYTFNIEVSGNINQILNKKSVAVEVQFKKQHLLDPDNLAVLQLSYKGVLEWQRMIAYMPSTLQAIITTISTTLPNLCEYEIVDGEPKYYLGGEETTELKYLEYGCCNVDLEKLKDESAIELYSNKCTAEDMVKLTDVCINDEAGEYTKSYAYQKNIDSIMENIKDAENQYINHSYNTEGYRNALNNYNNNIEREYSSTGLSSGNDYCRMYTSEKVDILLPGTVEATSGRYFIFKKGHQPLVDGKIYADFHTDVDRWLADFTSAYENEKDRYNNWQNAIVTANEKAKELEEEEAKYNAAKEAEEEPDEKALNDARAAKAAADSAELSSKRNYNSAVSNREKLKKYKTECERKTNIATSWKYILDPNVTFYYKQKVNQIDKNNLLTGKAETITEKVEMKPSYKSDGKYWLGVSDPTPVLINGSKKGTSSTTSVSLAGYGGIPGGITVNYDRTSDYQIGYSQKIYYIPSTYFYSLLPSGQYITSKETRSDVNLLDVGYVFNTEVTNYEGEYETWFETDNIGHQHGKEMPNIQKSINKYLLNNKERFPDHEDRISGDIFASKCFYYNKEILYTRGCYLDCDHPEADTELRSQIYYRTISIYNVNPNNRENTNWATEKGIAAKKAIEAVNDEIYDDYTKKNLEYSFTLTTKDMADIKKYNKDNTYDDFRLTCVNGKECKSSFIEIYADSDILAETRSSKWKYFKNGVFESGSIESVLGGTYPEASEELINWP